ncbi:MAG TPA: XDD4 family exosortase-dependent surface protein [Chthonomonadaceae bacterium]|nr:XDD4 family exosortase-dependent surface protein [Chthonomonadaceae bacterium]
MKGFIRFGVVALALICSTGTLKAQTFFGGTSPLHASATFSITGGGDLDIIFTNLATTAASGNAAVLTGLFFDVSGATTFSRTGSSIDANGSSYVNGSLSGVLGDHWAANFGRTLSGAPGGALNGIGASGLGGVFGSNDSFSGSGGSPQGVDYGLVGPGGPGSVNSNQGPQLQNSIHVVLHSTTPLASNAVISNVWFQYGSALQGEPGFPGVPAPPALLTALMGAAMPGAGFVMQRLRRRQNVTA